MGKENTPKPLVYAATLIALFFLSTFATSYRKSVQAAVPVLPATIKNPALPSQLPPESDHEQILKSQPSPPAADTDQSMESVIDTLSPDIRPKLRKLFIRKGISYPPRSLTLIALKKERRLEIWSPDDVGNKHLVIIYPILGESGSLGPKLHQGDLQVPEGVYKILWFNPNSQFYLSMKINYPNKFDQRMAELDGRTDLGGDIFIHGYDVSIGCLAIGNPAIEELFLLVYDTGKKNTRVIIAPYDFRIKTVPSSEILGTPLWTDMLYKELNEELQIYTRKSQKHKTS